MMRCTDGYFDSAGRGDEFGGKNLAASDSACELRRHRKLQAGVKSIRRTTTRKKGDKRRKMVYDEKEKYMLYCSIPTTEHTQHRSSKNV